MTTTVVYSSTADGHINSANAAYATARTGGTLTVDTSTSSQNAVGQVEFFGYNCAEGFLDFDTSGIPDADTVSAAVLDVYGSQDSSTTNFTIEARLQNWGGTLTTADWVSGADLGTPTLLASRSTASGWSTSAYNTFTDTAFPANVNKTGVTYVMLCSDRHRVGNDPGAGGSEFVRFYSADDSGTTRDPKLTVTHAGAGNPWYSYAQM